MLTGDFLTTLGQVTDGQPSESDRHLMHSRTGEVPNPVAAHGVDHQPFATPLLLSSHFGRSCYRQRARVNI